jgi:hypothetical protein
MNWTEITAALRHLSEPAYLYVGGAALALALLLMLLKRRQPKNVVAYTTENGRVMVSRAAIIELVRTSCEQLNDVSKPSVRIQTKGRFTHFDVRLKLTSGGRLKDIEQTLQTHLRQGLTENLGIENLGKINIVATGFKSGRIELSSPITKEERAPSAPVQDSSATEALEPEFEGLEEELEQKPL